MPTFTPTSPYPGVLSPPSDDAQSVYDAARGVWVPRATGQVVAPPPAAPPSIEESLRNDLRGVASPASTAIPMGTPQAGTWIPPIPRRQRPPTMDESIKNDMRGVSAPASTAAPPPQWGDLPQTVTAFPVYDPLKPERSKLPDYEDYEGGKEPDARHDFTNEPINTKDYLSDEAYKKAGGGNWFAEKYNQGMATAERAAGTIADASGKMYTDRKPPARDEGFAGRVESGMKVAEGLKLDLSKVRFQGENPIMAGLPVNGISQEDRENLFSYLTYIGAESLKAQGRHMQDFGTALQSHANEIEPLWMRADRYQRALAKIETRLPGVSKSWGLGDITGMTDILVADAYMSGDKSYQDMALRIQGAAREAQAEDADNRTGWADKLINDTVGMLPMMGRGMLMKAGALIPGANLVLGPVGEILSTSMWARQGMGDAIRQIADAGGDPSQAMPLLIGTGLAYALVENIQVGQVFSSGAKKAAGPILQRVAQIVKEKGNDFLKENAEEVAQDILLDSAVKKALAAQGIKYDSGTLKERIAETLKGSMGPMAVLSLAGAGAGAGKTAVRGGNVGRAQADAEELPQDVQDALAKQESARPEITYEMDAKERKATRQKQEEWDKKQKAADKQDIQDAIRAEREDGRWGGINENTPPANRSVTAPTNQNDNSGKNGLGDAANQLPQNEVIDNSDDELTGYHEQYAKRGDVQNLKDARARATEAEVRQKTIDRWRQGGRTEEDIQRLIADEKENAREARFETVPWLEGYEIFTDKEVATAVERLQGENIPFAVEATDLGNFSGLNAHAGHVGADEHAKAVIADTYLKEIAEFGGIAVRRKGADEFAVIWPGFTADEVEPIREAIEKKIKKVRDARGLSEVPYIKGVEYEAGGVNYKLPAGLKTGSLHSFYGIVDGDKTTPYHAMYDAADDLSEKQKGAFFHSKWGSEATVAEKEKKDKKRLADNTKTGYNYNREGTQNAGRKIIHESNGHVGYGGSEETVQTGVLRERQDAGRMGSPRGTRQEERGELPEDIRHPAAEQPSARVAPTDKTGAPLSPEERRAISQLPQHLQDILRAQGVPIDADTENRQNAPENQIAQNEPVDNSPKNEDSKTDSEDTDDVYDKDDLRFAFIGKRGAKALDERTRQRGEGQQRLDNKTVAEEMEAGGKDATTIKMATGWERGADNEWRYEIPDFPFDVKELQQLNDNRLNYNFRKRKPQPEYHANLSTLIKDADLVASLEQAYGRLPELAFSTEIRTSGEYDPHRNSIDISTWEKGDRIISVLVHELQHWIQYKEGFARGADLKGKSYTDYHNAAGEVEARNAAKRRRFTDEERRRSLASETEDVSRDEQIARFDSPSFESAETAGVPAEHLEKYPNARKRARELWEEKGTDSPFFKKWFGDSKVVDEDGKPLVVYHGGDKNIKIFGNELEKGLFFFAREYSLASNYVGYNQDRAEDTVHEIYLKVTNPLRIRTVEDVRKLAESIGGEVGDDINHTYDWNKEQYTEGLALSRITTTHRREIVDYAKSHGFDGIFNIEQDIYGHDGGEGFIVFSPNQIKSATDNTGTFDGENPDIRFARRGGKNLPSMEEARAAIPENKRRYFERMWDRAAETEGAKIDRVRMAIGKVNSRLNKEASDVLGKKINAEKQYIRLKDVRHIDEIHGIGKEKDPAQIPVTKEAFILVTDVLENFDEIRKGSETAGRDSVKLTRHYSDGKVVIADAVLEDGNFIITSMFIKRPAAVRPKNAETPSGSRLSNQRLRQPNSPRGPRPRFTESVEQQDAMDNKISDSAPEVNRENEKDENSSADPAPISKRQFERMLTKLARTGLAKDVITDADAMREKLARKFGKDNADRFMSVWHGSPHAFDAFSTAFMGTGEGAQAYGWGLYFTDKRGIAEGYTKNNRSERSREDKITMTVGGKQYTETSKSVQRFSVHNPASPIEEVASKLLLFGDINALRMACVNTIKDAKKNITKLSKILETISAPNFTCSAKTEPSRRTYQTLAQTAVVSINGETTSYSDDYNPETFAEEVAEQIVLAKSAYWNGDLVEISKKYINDKIKHNEKNIAGSMNTLKIINDTDFKFEIKSNKPDANLYRVKIHGDKTVDDLNFMRWDKPPTDAQHQAIINGLKQLKRNKTGYEDLELNNDEIDGTINSIRENTEYVGDVIYGNLADLFYNQKAASEFLLRAGIDGIQYPTGYKSKGSHEDSYNYVVFDDKALEIVEHIRLMATPKGETYGFATTDGVIYLDPDKMNANTPIHEYGHLWIDFVKKHNKPMYNRLTTTAAQSKFYKDLKANPAYAHLSDKQRAEEAAACAIGNIGEMKFTNETALEKFRGFLRDLWNWVAERLGLDLDIGDSDFRTSRLSADDIGNMTFDELAEGATRELLGGRRIGEAEGDADSEVDGDDRFAGRGGNYISGESSENEGQKDVMAKAEMYRKGIGREEAYKKLFARIGESGDVVTLRNDNDGEEVLLSKRSVKKLLSGAAAKKSVINGFTVEQHYAVAADIEDVFTRSVKILSRPDRDGNQTTTIHQFTAPLHFKDAEAFMTVKEDTRFGKKMYSVELMEIKKPGGTLAEAREDSRVQPRPGLDLDGGRMLTEMGIPPHGLSSGPHVYNNNIGDLQENVNSKTKKDEKSSDDDASAEDALAQYSPLIEEYDARFREAAGKIITDGVEGYREFSKYLEEEFDDIKGDVGREIRRVSIDALPRKRTGAVEFTVLGQEFTAYLDEKNNTWKVEDANVRLQRGANIWVDKRIRLRGEAAQARAKRRGLAFKSITEGKDAYKKQERNDLHLKKVRLLSMPKGKDGRVEFTTGGVDFTAKYNSEAKTWEVNGDKEQIITLPEDASVYMDKSEVDILKWERAQLKRKFKAAEEAHIEERLALEQGIRRWGRELKSQINAPTHSEVSDWHIDANQYKEMKKGFEDKLAAAEEAHKLSLGVQRYRWRVQQVIYDYARRLGLNKLSPDWPSMLLDKPGDSTLHKAREAMHKLDDIWYKQEGKRLGELIEKKATAMYITLNRLQHKRASTVDLEANLMMREMIEGLKRREPDDFYAAEAERWRVLNAQIDSALDFYNRYATDRIRNNPNYNFSGIKEENREAMAAWIEGRGSTPEFLTKAVKAMFKYNIDHMTNEEKDDWLQGFDEIRKEGRTRREAEKKKVAAEREKQVREILAAIESVPGNARKLGAAESVVLKSGIIFDNLRPELLLRIIEGSVGKDEAGALTKHMFTPLVRGENKYLVDVYDAFETLREVHANLNLAFERENELRTPEGKSLSARIKDAETGEYRPLTINEGMAVYAYSKNEHSLRHLLATDFANNPAEDVAKAVIAEICAALPPSHREAIDKVHTYFGGSLGPLLSEMFAKEHQVDMRLEEFYFSIRGLDTDGTGAAGVDATMEELKTRYDSKQAFLNKGMTKARTNSNAPFARLDYIGTLTASVQDALYTLAFNDAITNANALLNDRSIVKTLNSISKRIVPELRQYYKDVANMGRRRSEGGGDSTLDKLAPWLSKNIAMGYMGGNVSTMIKQFISIPQAAGAMDGPKGALSVGQNTAKNALYVAKAAVGMSKDWEAMKEFVYDRSMLVANRATNWEREFAEMVKSGAADDIMLGKGKVNKLKALYAKMKASGLSKKYKAAEVQRATHEALMYGAQLGDQFSAITLWKARYDQIMDTGASEVEAIESADELIRRTQSQGSVINLPRTFRSRNWAERSWTMFLNQPNQVFNMFADTVLGAKNRGAWKTAYRTLMAHMLPSYLVYLISKGRPAPDEPEELIDIMADDAFGGVVIWSFVPTLSTRALTNWVREARGREKLTGFAGVSSPLLEQLDKWSEMIESPRKALGWAGAEALARGFGVPTTAIKRFYGAGEVGYEAISDRDYGRLATDATRRVWLSESALKDRSVAAAMVKRALSTNLDTYKRFSDWYDGLNDANKWDEFGAYYNRTLNQMADRDRKTEFRLVKRGEADEADVFLRKWAERRTAKWDVVDWSSYDTWLDNSEAKEKKETKKEAKREFSDALESSL